MRILLASAVLIGCGLAAPASAMPRAPAGAALQQPLTLIAQGCGPGRSRDVMGHCRQRFNLFDQHRRFQAYKQRYCTPVRTPNGKVGFCKI